MADGTARILSQAIERKKGFDVSAVHVGIVKPRSISGLSSHIAWQFSGSRARSMVYKDTSGSDVALESESKGTTIRGLILGKTL
jgi:hypothetical protein